MSRKRFTKLLVLATQGSMANTRSVEIQNGGPAWKAELLSCRNQMPLMFVLEERCWA